MKPVYLSAHSVFLTFPRFRLGEQVLLDNARTATVEAIRSKASASRATPGVVEVATEYTVSATDSKGHVDLIPVPESSLSPIPKT